LAEADERIVGKIVIKKRTAQAAQFVGGVAGIASAIGFSLGSKPLGLSFAVLALALVVPAGLILYRK
jgi:hypothetical protein